MARKTAVTKRSYTKSRRAHERALRYFPGGVNSPVRAFGNVGGNPPFIQSGKGAIISDVDDNQYIDYVGSWGPLILGHAHPKVVAAISMAAKKGASFGAPTEAETKLAVEITKRVPSMERLRLVNSGTEATMSALRLARGVTGRDKIIKFDGCYHGHADSLLVKAGSGALTFGSPDSAGVPADFAKHTLVAQFNNLDSVAALFKSNPGGIAALIVEPVAGNMGCVPPEPGFLEGLRELCNRHGALLIFDEVMTGFRVAYGSAQARFKIKPDLTCLGKVVGGGLPLAVYGGRGDLMKKISPEGAVYQAGTLSGNPLAVAAGLATLAELKPASYRTLEARGKALERGLAKTFKSAGVPAQVQRVGAMMCVYFSETPVKSFADVQASNLKFFTPFFWGMLEEGVYLAPSPYEAGFLSLAHTDALIARTVKAAERVLGRLCA